MGKPPIVVHVHGPGRAAISLSRIGTRTGALLVAGMSGGGPAGAAAAREVLGVYVPWRADPPAESLAELVLLGVPDDALPVAVSQLASMKLPAGAAVVHLSGIRGRDALRALESPERHVAAFHPLRSFPSRDPGEGDLGGALVAIESGLEWSDRLHALAVQFGGQPFELSAEGRGFYHLGASMASNASLAILEFAGLAMREAGVPEKLAQDGLLRLVEGTLANVKTRGTISALTGPVVRGDVRTVSQHLESIEARFPEHRRLYLELVGGLLRLAEQRPDRSQSEPVRRWWLTQQGQG